MDVLVTFPGSLVVKVVVELLVTAMVLSGTQEFHQLTHVLESVEHSGTAIIPLTTVLVIHAVLVLEMQDMHITAMDSILHV
jgi:hypothetical protein